MELCEKAQIPGFPGVRYTRDTPNSEIMAFVVGSTMREKAYLASKGHTGPLPPSKLLALSGGGDKGAFGAGLLLGWSASGKRPQFREVTGISAGALIAPFAFAGQSYDWALREIFTNISPRDIYRPRPLALALFEASTGNSEPLRKLIRHYADQALLDAVAAEYAKGRMLFVGTTNLDARKGVAWDMGRIAASDHPGALRLFQDVLIASCAIPAKFEPMFFEVEAGGKRYREMHVDGEVMNQIFFYRSSLHLKELWAREGIERDRTIYAVENAYVHPSGRTVPPRTLNIAMHSIECLIQQATLADLDRMYLLSRLSGVHFNLAYIPATFNPPHPEEFERKYMRDLFDYAYDLGVRGYPWKKLPPNFQEAGPTPPSPR